ncbi:hypothetical protein ACJMK2_042220 [Sinanodonta woodiana]|uniref:G-protein coupled receptors family 1 profile domain-containing protein n=1 Tax=Sinanodonta woodiana TaxID=1069815 RepID=A0ABD3W6M2_SINWO
MSETLYCNNSSNGLSNESEKFVNTCVDIEQCVPLSMCLTYIEDFVRPTALEWVFIALYSVIFILGLLGNGLVCFVVFRCRHMQTAVNIFIVNLAIADFMVILVCLPPSLLADTTETWYLGEVMCKVVHFLQVKQYLPLPSNTLVSVSNV